MPQHVTFPALDDTTLTGTLLHLQVVHPRDLETVLAHCIASVWLCASP